MKPLYIIGNWKANKTEEEAGQWLTVFEEKIKSVDLTDKHIVLCPPMTLIATMDVVINEKELPMVLGGQTVSQFSTGAYTGEIPATLLSEYATYVLIGHSERRKYFHETDEVLFEKVKRAQETNLYTVYCVYDENTPIPEGVHVVAYEPVAAIGTGNPDTPENANRIAQLVKEKHPLLRGVIYGGSVTPENVHEFTKQEYIDGVLPGKASLDPETFVSIIRHA